jgi:hypothetical protein
VGEDTPLVVDHVAVAAAGSLDLFDDPVEPFGSGVVDIVNERGEDGWPPGLDGAGKSGRFGQMGIDRGLIEVSQPRPDLRRLSLAEEEAEAFLDRPRGLNLFRWVAVVEGSPEPVPLLR